MLFGMPSVIWIKIIDILFRFYSLIISRLLEMKRITTCHAKSKMAALEAPQARPPHALQD